MPPNNLVKFVNRTGDSNGRGKLHWQRADIDGAPYRGTPPSFTQDEWDERVVKVADPRNGTFVTSDAVQNKSYLEVLDGIANGWFQLIFIERWREPNEKHHTVYVEWLEYFMEDGSRAPAVQAGALSYGSPNISTPPH